jgi:hypothetical protein
MHTALWRAFEQVAPLLHDRRVAEVQAQVKAWNAAGLRGKKLMCTARQAFLTMSTRTATFKVSGASHSVLIVLLLLIHFTVCSICSLSAQWLMQ